MYLCYCKKLYKMKKKVRSFCLDQWWSFPLCLWQQILVSLVSQTVPLYFRRYPSDWRLSACSSLDTTLDAHLSSYPLALFFTDFLSLLYFARFKAVGGSCLAECLVLQEIFRFFAMLYNLYSCRVLPQVLPER